MEKVLITGATGFIGNYVVEELLRNNVKVIATSASKGKAMRYPWFEKVTYKSLDFTELNKGENYFNYFFQPTRLIHLAWEGLPNYNAPFHMEDNLSRHFLFLESLMENGLKDITVTGTCLEYGLQEGRAKEDDEVNPTTSYAFAKNELRIRIEELCNKQPKALKWVRLFYMYGKGQNNKSLLSQLEKALEDGEATFNMSGGEQVRDYLPVEKVAEYIVKIAMQDTITGTINCCSGQPISIKELVKRYLQEKGRNIKLNLGFYPYTTYEPMAIWGSNEKLIAIVGDK